MNSNALSLMIRLCLQNEGRLSNSKRKNFAAKGYPATVLDTVERIATDVLAGRDPDDNEIDIPPYRPRN